MKYCFVIVLLLFSNLCLGKDSGGGGCQGTYDIYIEYRTNFHTALIPPSKYLAINDHFSLFSHVEFNWGDEGFYRAGNDLTEQVLKSFSAMMYPTPSVVYLRPYVSDTKELYKSCHTLRLGRKALS